MTTYKVGYIIGSLAAQSINRTLSKALIRLAPPELEFAEILIKDLPLYSYDYDSDSPRRQGTQGGHRRRRRHPVRDSGI
ncbi:NADPH-dependent FMN reductase [Streptomyces scopuliridis]|uniref:NADPH-dependent FMN reductase n=1 Tax=Streptomyces scopuliridis TaxID=452529 RepID=UPI0036C85844